MRIIRRYLIREIFAPTLISVLVFTFVMVMDVIFDIAELALKKNLGIILVTKLFMLNLPHIIVLTIPMSVLLGTIVAFSRLSADSEIVAFRSAGISLFKLLQPTLIFAFLVTLLTAYLMIYMLPWGNKSLLRLEENIFSISMTNVVEPRVFYDDFPQKVIYFHEYGTDEREWRGVFLADSSAIDEKKIINAESARLHYDEELDQLWLLLANGSINISRNDDPSRYQFSSFAEMRALLKDGVLRESRAKAARAEIHDPKLRARTTGELLEIIQRSKTPELKSRYNMAWVNIHKKFSIPFSCLVLALIGISLGISNSRGGKSSGFVIAIGVIIVYWIFIDLGEALSIQGRMPPYLGMWLPNIVLGCLGLALLFLRSKNRNFDISESSVMLWYRFRRRIRHNETDGKSSIQNGTVPHPSTASPLSQTDLVTNRASDEEPGDRKNAGLANGSKTKYRRLYIPFPNILDRYILSQYFRIFFMVFTGFVALFFIVDFFQLLDLIVKNHIPAATVLQYYKFIMPQVSFFIFLLINLVTTLITFAIFSKHNEVTAFKGCGISLYRIAIPILLVALLTSVFTFYLDERIVPYSNQQADRLKDTIKGNPVSTHYRIRKWIFGESGNRIYNYENINFERQTMASLSVFDFSARDFVLKRWTHARHAVFDDGAWQLKNGWTKSFSGQQELNYEDFTNLRSNFVEDPTYFKKEWKETEQMNWRELSDYIDELQRSGYEVDPELKVDFQFKFSMPFVPLVMAILGLSFAFKMGKKGSLYGIGISVIFGIMYWVCIAFSKQLGDLGAFPPLIAAWAPNILFGISGLYMVLTLRT